MRRFAASFLSRFAPRFGTKLAPRLRAKLARRLDKSAGIVIGACWLAAMALAVMAIVAVHGATTAMDKVATAAQPTVPQVNEAPMDANESAAFFDRLQKQFPDVKFERGPRQTFVITSNDGSKFRQWITALSSFDMLEPQYRWTLSYFCVGDCEDQPLMKAVVAGRKVTFSLP